MIDFIQQNYEQITSALEKLSKFFQHELKQSEFALNYVQAERNLSTDSLLQFGVGYAPETAKTLKFLELNNIDPQILVDAGVWKVLDDVIQDRFEHRIIFPSFDLLGNVIGFTGREFLVKTPRKYMHCSNSVVFQKPLFLFGLYQALQTIQEKNYVILVEGNLDVVTMHQHGFTNTIASCGTSLMTEQLLILKNFADTCIILFDNDKAGKVASEKAKKLCDDLTMTPVVVELDGAKDPDVFLQKFNETKLQTMIERKLNES